MKTQLFRATVLKHAPFLSLLAFASGIHLPIFGDALNPDSTTYLEASRSLVFNASLRIETSLAPRHPPLMAMLLAPFGVAFGFNEFAVHVFELGGFIVLLTLVYAISRNLGYPFSLIPCTLVSLDPVLYSNMSDGRALCTLMVLALVTLVAVWKGLTDTRWLLVAAVGASLAYLTADTVGYLFVAGGLVGLAWRFYYVRWAVFRNRSYLAAMSLFALVVLTWISYNVVSGGTIYTDPRVVGYLDKLLLRTHLDIGIVVVSGFVVYFLVYLGQTGISFIALRGVRRSLSSIPRLAFQDQRIGAMLIFIIVTVVISAFAAAAFVLYEPLRNLEYADTYLRYAAVVAPITYVGISRTLRASGESRRSWLAPFAVALFILIAQFVPQVFQRDASSEWFAGIQRELSRHNVTSVYSDFAIYLRYNIPGIVFISVDKGYAEASVNITAGDVPFGSPLLTFVYVPAVYDERVQGLYFIYHFDPSINSPFVNLYYRE